MQRAILPAVLTGAFCSVFALGIDAATDALSILQLVILSFTSGFLGSLFARVMLGRK